MRKEKDDSLNEIYLLHFLGFEQQRRMLPVLSRTGVRARVERRSAPWRAVRIDAVARPSVRRVRVRQGHGPPRRGKEEEATTASQVRACVTAGCCAARGSCFHLNSTNFEEL